MTRETSLYLLAFALALAVRLIGLGELPLSDAEAIPALQAHQVAGGQIPVLGADAAYVAVTSALFYIFSSSNALARLFPALAGVLLLLVPFLWRGRLPAHVGLILAFGLALDPGMVALSRTAGSGMLAITFSLLALTWCYHANLRAAGVSATLALMSGVPFWMGILPIAAVVALLLWAGKSLKMESGAGESASMPWRDALIWGVAVFASVGSILFLVPQNIGAALSGLPAFFAAWTQPAEVSALRLVLALLLYHPLAWLFALVSIGRGLWARDARLLGLALWFVLAFALALLSPARQVTDLAWALLPLWALSAWELARHLQVGDATPLEAGGLAALLAVIGAFAYFDLAAIANQPMDETQLQLAWVLLIGALFLAALSVALMALGWSLDSARVGATWGTVALLAIGSISAMWGVTGLRPEGSLEMWRAGSQVAQAKIMETTLNQLSDMSLGAAGRLDITLWNAPSPALRWLLREWQVTETGALGADSSPAVVIAPLGTADLALGAAYRGQDFSWQFAPRWDQPESPQTWVRWLVFRTFPHEIDTVVLWARTDIFPDGR
jgi:hypothetical protein